MPRTIHSSSVRLHRERDRIVGRDGDDDGLPIRIAGSIIVALSLSLWVSIGVIVSPLV